MEDKANEKPQKGKALTVYIIIMVIISIFGIFNDISGKTRDLPTHINYPNWMFFYLSAANILSLLFDYGMWQMKKWGVFGAIALIIVTSSFILSFQHAPKDILTLVIGIIIFALIVWTPYKRMT